MPQIIDICTGANERFMIGATAAFTGIALNSSPETRLRFHIFTEGVKPETILFMRKVLVRTHPNCEVIEHVCDEKLLAGLPYWAGSQLSAARIFYPYLLPDIDWVLYVDCDVLYFTSPEEHFYYRNNDAYVCVTQEEDEFTRNRERKWIKDRCHIDIPDAEYFNAGVMLFNLKKCREEHTPEKIQQFYKTFPDVALPDQTAMNVIFNGGKVLLSPKYDRLQIYFSDKKLKEHPVLHYVSGNPWLPKMGVVGNCRFRMWHYFCDKYIWLAPGKSYEKCFPMRVLLVKKSLYYLLRLPVLGVVIAKILQFSGMTGNGTIWRDQQIKHDCSMQTVKEIV